MSTTPRTRQILLIASESDETALAPILLALGDVRVTRDARSAADALNTGGVDLVIASAADLLPLAGLTARQQTENTLESIGQPVCIVSRDGRLVWANARLRSYPERSIDEIRDACVRLFARFAADSAPAGSPRSIRMGLRVGSDLFFDLTASPMLNSALEVVQVVAILVDTTASRKLQEKINAIDAAGAELVRLDLESTGEMDVHERLALLEDKIIRYTRDLMHFDHFTVRVLDIRSKRLDTVLAGGMSEEAKCLPIYAYPEGNGISGYVAASGRSYICPDVTKDARYLPGLDNAGSSLTVPLRLHDQIVGILNVESDRVAAFSEDDRQFAEIFGRYVAIALNILKLLAVERCTATDQIASDVASELAGPLNDIVADASTIIEDYIGHDDLRHRVHVIIDNVDKLKRTLQSVTQRTGVTGLSPETATRDPVIGGKRILIAEDEDIIRETISDVLTKYGAITQTASDGSAAIAMIRAQHFDLVLSDIKMPQADGYEIFSAVKAGDVHTPVILITGFGYDPSHSIIRASKEGLAAVLFKPFKVERLVEDVRHALTSNTI
ncbi:MAG: Regulator of RpoS [Phycisphaerae bacterium]|nr:Regulator of RpoS [Phycisphaerae bacterium]